jgi:hypothetical protein
MVDRNIQAEVPAPGAGDMEQADVGEFLVESVDDGFCFVCAEVEGIGVGKDDPFLVRGAGAPGRRTASSRRALRHCLRRAGAGR